MDINEIKRRLKEKHPDVWADIEVDNRYQLAKRIELARIKAGLTQRALGILIGMTQARISRIESGESNLTIDTLGKIARALRTRLILPEFSNDQSITFTNVGGELDTKSEQPQLSPIQIKADDSAQDATETHYVEK
jgi:transcriptional regulator with XRE-family HTH domain